MHVSQVFLGSNVSPKDMRAVWAVWRCQGGFGELLQLWARLASEWLWGSLLCVVPMACASLGSLGLQGQMPEGTELFSVGRE